MKVETNKDQLLTKGEFFLNKLDETELRSIGDATCDILYDFDTAGFFIWASGYKHTGNSIIVFNSDGMGEVEMSVGEVRKYLLEDIDGCLENVRYSDRF